MFCAYLASLRLDDIQDGSQLRRGQSSAHVIFGEGQTITAATFQYIEAVATLQKLNNPRCLDIFIDEVRSMFVGQSYDLAWIWERKCPTVQEYLQMVDGSKDHCCSIPHFPLIRDAETGGLFRLLARLMAAESSSPIGADLDLWCHHLGRYYQIRDDYQNLVSEEVSIKVISQAFLTSSRSTPTRKACARTSTKANTLCHSFMR
jgi:geranylgeranyl pyrophosphate synthase